MLRADDLVRRHGVTPWAVDEGEAAIGAEEEALPDVPTRLASVLTEQGVDLPVVVRRPARVLDRRDQQLPGAARVGRRIRRRAGVVLDLLDRQEVRRAQVRDDQPGERGELRGRVPSGRGSRR